VGRIVAIHGLGCSADQGWPRVRQALGDRHDLITPRLDGADGPARLPRSEWGLRAQAARIAREVGPADLLVGHSMGGALAIRVAQAVRPKRLLLVEPHLVPSAGFVVRPTLASGPSGPSADLLAKMRTIDTGEGPYSEWIRRWDWNVFHAMSIELEAGDGGKDSWLEALARLDLPVEHVWGAKSGDPMADLHTGALLTAKVPMRTVAGSAHFIPSEAPQEFARLLAATADRC